MVCPARESPQRLLVGAPPIVPRLADRAALRNDGAAILYLPCYVGVAWLTTQMILVAINYQLKIMIYLVIWNVLSEPATRGSGATSGSVKLSP